MAAPSVAPFVSERRCHVERNGIRLNIIEEIGGQRVVKHIHSAIVALKFKLAPSRAEQLAQFEDSNREISAYFASVKNVNQEHNKTFVGEIHQFEMLRENLLKVQRVVSLDSLVEFLANVGETFGVACWWELAYGPRFVDKWHEPTVLNVPVEVTLTNNQ